MTDVFERARAIAAHEVAAREGLELSRKGERHWARCPFHADKTPSLCFFKDGGRKCFSCSAGGDSTRFLAMYRGISNLDAAKLLAGDSGAKYTPRPRTPTAEEQREASAKEYRRIMHDSNATMSARIEVVGSGADIMEDEAFGKALNAYWWASDNLDNLDARTEVERLEGWCGRHGCD